MKSISPCHPMFACPNINMDKELCEDSCANLALYRSFLDKENFFRKASPEGDVTYYSLPLADPMQEGCVEDPYASLLALETVVLNLIEAEESVIEESIDTSFGRPLYNSYFAKGGEA